MPFLRLGNLKLRETKQFAQSHPVGNTAAEN